MSDKETLRGLRNSVWLEQARYEQAETKYQEQLADRHAGIHVLGHAVSVPTAQSGLSDSIEATMTIIRQSLESDTQTTRRMGLEQRVSSLEKENTQLKRDLQELRQRVGVLESRLGGGVAVSVEVDGAGDLGEGGGEDEESDFDLFGSDKEDEEEASRERERRVQDYQQKKAKKPAVVAKSTIILDVKPWDTETDMSEIERLVRGVVTDGLIWGASKLVPVAYGIRKLQISCVVEDEKVGTDFLEETITAFEDHVQSVDVVAFNKI